MNGHGLPNKQLDRHILFVSAVLGLDAEREYTEKQLNDELRKWSERFGANVCLDHVTLRRFLVDEGYLTRDAAGTAYILKKEGLPYTFDQSIWSLDLQELINSVRRDREKRKRLRQQDGSR